MIRDHNLTTHTYKQKTADAIASAILSSYAAEFEKFQKRFIDLEGEVSS
jgi:hypothetical protein